MMARRWTDHRLVAGAPLRDADPDQVGRAQQLHRGERRLRRLDDRAQADDHDDHLRPDAQHQAQHREVAAPEALVQPGAHRGDRARAGRQADRPAGEEEGDPGGEGHGGVLGGARHHERMAWAARGLTRQRQAVDQVDVVAPPAQRFVQRLGARVGARGAAGPAARRRPRVRRPAPRASARARRRRAARVVDDRSYSTKMRAAATEHQPGYSWQKPRSRPPSSATRIADSPRSRRSCRYALASATSAGCS